MNKTELIEVLMETVREAQDIVNESLDITGDSLIRGQVLLFLMNELLQANKEARLPRPQLSVARPIPTSCPHMSKLQFDGVWTAKCKVTNLFCNVDLGLTDFTTCLHFRAQKAKEEGI